MIHLYLLSMVSIVHIHTYAFNLKCRLQHVGHFKAVDAGRMLEGVFLCAPHFPREDQLTHAEQISVLGVLSLNQH